MHAVTTVWRLLLGMTLLLLPVVTIAADADVQNVPMTLAQWVGKPCGPPQKDPIAFLNVVPIDTSRTVVISVDQGGTVRAFDGTWGDCLWSRTLYPNNKTALGAWVKGAGARMMYIVAFPSNGFVIQPLTGSARSYQFAPQIIWRDVPEDPDSLYATEGPVLYSYTSMLQGERLFTLPVGATSYASVIAGSESPLRIWVSYYRGGYLVCSSIDGRGSRTGEVNLLNIAYGPVHVDSGVYLIQRFTNQFCRVLRYTDGNASSTPMAYTLRCNNSPVILFGSFVD